MLSAGVDTLVMGCTHYPFIIPILQDIAGPGVRVIDPAPAVARQTERLAQSLTAECIDRGVKGEIEFLTTGSTERLAELIPDLLGEIGPVRPLSWQEGRLIES
jgi:glutamate racemase